MCPVYFVNYVTGLHHPVLSPSRGKEIEQDALRYAGIVTFRGERMLLIHLVAVNIS
jgi:hypothetical protein